jgi:hypothetical protein
VVLLVRLAQLVLAALVAQVVLALTVLLLVEQVEQEYSLVAMALFKGVRGV